jgi:hypothetical protein
MIMKRMFFIVVFNLSWLGSYAQQTDCERIFNSALEKVKSFRTISSQHGFEMACTIQITSSNGRVQRDRIEIKTWNEKYQYITDKMSLYQDEKTLVVIQKDQKSIFITRPMPKEKQQNEFYKSLSVQDSVQKHMKLRSCTNEFGAVEKHVGYLKMVYEPTEELKSSGLKSIIYWLDQERLEIKRIVINYAAEALHGLKTYDLVINRLNQKVTTSPFTGDALTKVMQGKALRAEYSGYTCTDKRN